jgi:hypothetical protein
VVAVYVRLLLTVLKGHAGKFSFNVLYFVLTVFINGAENGFLPLTHMPHI